VVAGGESGSTAAAHAQTEAFDFDSQGWRTLEPMRTPRHSAQAIVSNGGFYVAAGSDQRGGPTGVALDLEALYLDGATSPAPGSITPGSLDAPASVAFGTVAPGDQSQRTIVLDNSGGDQAMVLEDVALAGDAAFLLDSAPTMPIVLAPGAQVALVVDFAPGAPGPHAATLTVQRSGGADAVIELAGSGQGAVVQADLSVSIMDDKDPVAAGSSLLYTVTVHNAGPSAATGVIAETTLSEHLSAAETVGCSGDPTGVPTCLLGTIAAGAQVNWLISVDVE